MRKINNISLIVTYTRSNDSFKLGSLSLSFIFELDMNFKYIESDELLKIEHIDI